MGWLAKLTGTSGTDDHSEPKPEPASRYRGVQVVANADGCCRAVDAIAGQRYLPQQVPKLPLEGCDFANCQCTYQLFNDRRTDLRRASDISYDIASELHSAENRRTESVGRRESDS